MKIAIERIEPFVKFSAREDVSIPLYDSQAELQLLSKLRSQSYRAYIAGLSKLPASDIATDLSSTSSIDIKREDTELMAQSLLPTQRELFLDHALPKLKDDDGPNFYKDTVEIVAPIITFNNQFIIDGHHRWLTIVLLNPKAKITAINFSCPDITPIQFLKLLQGAIVLDAGELPSTPKDNRKRVDLFHSSNKVILDYISKTVPFKILEFIKQQLALEDTERSIQFIYSNALSIKYNNLPAVGSPSRELMPQTNNSIEVLDIVEDAPVLAPQEQ